ncbi:MAG: ABC transporter substrate binding protein [Nitrospiraceae bacterium]|nr:ABC transporter substrate binding protein [Nitrospiraceae bacterium]
MKQLKKAILNIFLLGLMMVLLPAVSYGAGNKIIGVIMAKDVPYYEAIHKEFIRKLTGEGSRAQVIVQRPPADDPMSIANTVRKMSAYGASVIVSYGPQATSIALKEAEGVPVVFAGVSNPGAFARKATGISSRVPAAGIIKNLKSISNFSTLGVVYLGSSADSAAQASEIRGLEGNFGFKYVRLNLRTLKSARVGAVFLTNECATTGCFRAAVSAARRSRIPAAATTTGGESSGILLTIAADPAEQGDGAAMAVAQVLQGRKPASIAVRQPRKIDVIIDLKEANAEGLKVPFDLLTSATKVLH